MMAPGPSAGVTCSSECSSMFLILWSTHFLRICAEAREDISNLVLVTRIAMHAMTGVISCSYSGHGIAGFWL